MGLMKAPSLMTFIIAVLIAFAALATKIGLVPIPFIGITSFWLLLGAFVLLILGNITRGF